MLVTIFHNMKIKNKLTAIIMLTSVLAVLLVSASVILYEYRDSKQKLVSDISSYAVTIADTSTSSLAFNNNEDADKILSTISATKDVVFACIYDQKENVFVKYQRSDITYAIHPPDIRKEGYYFSGDYLHVYKPVILDKEKIGTIYIQAGLDGIYSRLFRYIIYKSIITLVVLFLSYLFSTKLQKIISDPILNLLNIAKLVSEKKDYSVRVSALAGNDELGILTKSFNQMLEQIQQRDLALTYTNEQLDTRVKERTADLTREVAVRKKAEETLVSLNKTLETTVKNLTRTNQQLADFVNVASHDLKAPLRAIGTLASWIATDYGDKFDDEGRDKVRMLVGRAERMSKLLDSIAKYSDAGRILQSEERIDLNVLLDEIIDQINPPENIRIQVINDLPVLIKDKSSISQILENLLNNAIKYIDKPNGLITIDCVEEDSFWKFSVTDNGPGIEEEYFEKIFKIFQTLSPRDKRESIGIGLAIVKKIVDAYGGKVWVESELGRGSTFFFTLLKYESEVIENAQLEAGVVS